ncbi:hypothetical protein SVIOM74S_06975 [Streptomyces violarus]
MRVAVRRLGRRGLLGRVSVPGLCGRAAVGCSGGSGRDTSGAGWAGAEVVGWAGSAVAGQSAPTVAGCPDVSSIASDSSTEMP